MRGAYLSILGLYNWDHSIFENFYLPEGVDWDDVIENILIECAELEVIYPDPDFMKKAIQAWSHKQLPVWTKLNETLSYEYDPLENYDRKEDWSDSSEGTNTNRTDSSGNQSGSTHEENSDTGSNTLTVAGFNSNDLTNREKNDTINEGQGDTATQMEHEDTATSNGQSTHDATHTGRVHGNIGVTTSQQMIEAQREVVKFNIVDYIIDEFKKRFCILIY